MTNSVEAEEIPLDVEGFELFKRNVMVTAKLLAREIDHVFYTMGFDEIVPPVVRYVLAVTLCCMPVILVLVLLCCCNDDFL